MMLCEMTSQFPRNESSILGRLTALSVVSFLCLQGVAFAQTTDAQEVEAPVDPIDAMCAELGRPLSENEVSALSDFEILGLRQEYTEIVGDFEEGRARSVRYLPEDVRTAHFVSIRSRELCLTAPGSTEAICGIPLICNSDEADLVMVDSNDQPFVAINRDSGRVVDRNAPNTDGRDWVLFAGGTADVFIPSTQIGASRLSPTTNAKMFEPAGRACAVGAGHPIIDSAFSYVWPSNCQSANASGQGRVIYLSPEGEIGTIPMGPDVGIGTRGGRLYWSFPNDIPIELEVECQAVGDLRIPTSSDEVRKMVVQINVPDSVELSDQLIMRKIGETVNEYAEKICGTESDSVRREFNFEGKIRGGAASFGLVWLDDLERISSIPRQYLIRVASNNRTYRRVWDRGFASFIREKLEIDRRQEILFALEDREQLGNIANGMRSADVQTLLALGRGLTIPMPWATSNPSFSDGRFRLNWNMRSTDPAVAFFSNRQQTGWQSVQAAMRSPSLSPVNLNLTCLLPLARARGLTPAPVVNIEAVLGSYNGSNQMVLNCSAP